MLTRSGITSGLTVYVNFYSRRSSHIFQGQQVWQYMLISTLVDECYTTRYGLVWQYMLISTLVDTPRSTVLMLVWQYMLISTLVDIDLI